MVQAVQRGQKELQGKRVNVVFEVVVARKASKVLLVL